MGRRRMLTLTGVALAGAVALPDRRFDDYLAAFGAGAPRSYC